VTDDGAVTERTMRADEPHFEGHYPGNPLMPGVLLCEAVFQTAAVYMMKRFSSEVETEASKTPVLARIQEAKFKQMVRPGDTVRIETTFKETLGKFHFMRGKRASQRQTGDDGSIRTRPCSMPEEKIVALWISCS
jgi:3-hydroxyacyl-[acyl-carrier-protein] dehydratase